MHTAEQIIINLKTAEELIVQGKTALEVYASEMRPLAHARLVEPLDHFACWCGFHLGVEIAYPFCRLRWLT